MSWTRIYRVRKRLLMRELRFFWRAALSILKKPVLSEKAEAAAARSREQVSRSQVLTRDALFDYARVLAEQHQARIIGRGSRLLYRRFADHCRGLEIAHRSLEESARNSEVLTPGAEWLLDNYHLVLQQINDIKRHFPRGYDRSLPKLVSGKYADYPRVYHIALELLIQSDSVVNLDLLTSFVKGYQSHTTLTMGELWAVPIMLRFALIENLGSIVARMALAKEERKAAGLLIDEIIGDETRTATQVLHALTASLADRPEILFRGSSHIISRLREMGRRAYLALQWLEERLREEGLDPEEMHRNEQYLLAADQVSIGNTVNSLRSINLIDWKVWFESVSVVEQTLLRDPAGLHAKSDFKTRDSYRHVIERIAKRSGKAEVDVAQGVIALTKQRQEEFSSKADLDPIWVKKRSHIGFYLVGAGVGDLEQQLAFIQPWNIRTGRWLHRNAFLLYGLAVTAIMSLIVFHAADFSLRSGATPLAAAIIGLLFIVPASDLAINIVQWLVTRWVAPDFLPKLDYSKGIPQGCKTIVAVQTLLTDQEAVRRTVEALEVRYLANDDNQLVFGLLADFPDADSEETPSDRLIYDYTAKLFEELRARHGREKFFFLFRKRLWNPSQRKFMGWERKRGKIDEFNRLVRGKGPGSFILAAETEEIVKNAVYVITLDNDSQLPRGSARSLVGAIDHPMNSPIIRKDCDDRSKLPILEGYGIMQPRVGITLVSANSSLFAKIFSGHAGLDPYTQTVSEVYQDLFHEGSFVGKGIYHIEAFSRALEGRVPENSILSHDLFEGLFARVALATDIELFDDFPSRYLVHSRRQHRWVRGDWQLLPWIFPWIKGADGKRYLSPLSNLGRWKLIDNLRRSLLAPCLMALFLAALLAFEAPPTYFLMLLIVVIAFPVYANLAQAFLIPPRNVSMEGHVRGVGRDLIQMSKQAIITLCFLPHQAVLMLNAILVTLWRVLVSRKNLLEWETAYHAERRLGTSLKFIAVEMAGGAILTWLVLAAAFLGGPADVAATAPFFLLWVLSPLAAKGLSDPISPITYDISSERRSYLNELAFSTWRFFRELMTAENNYLAPDNIQLVPQRIVVDRTSVTNISLSILSAISANDLGFMSLNESVNLLEKTYKSLMKLDRFHGHFLNWYNIRTLTPLHPRYISMVDSGNMIGHMLAAVMAFQQAEEGKLFSEKHLSHLERLLRQALLFQNQAAKEISSAIEEALAVIIETRKSHAGIYKILAAASSVTESISRIENRSPVLTHCLMYLSDLCAVKSLFPDLTKVEACLAKFPQGEDKARLEKILSAGEPTVATLRKINVLLATLLPLAPQGPETSALGDSLVSSNAAIQELHGKLKYLHETSRQIVDEMDFGFLYDWDRNLFPVGYDVDNARRDQSYYDLLASEARLGSFTAIALGQVPQQHWFSLGRPLTDAMGGKSLLSWSGTMFEYLMPLLVMKSFRGTLLAESYKSSVRTQILYTKRRKIPWGISESGYSGVDFEKTYQYHAFGVPGLGLKRGLEDDLVISPYSTVMALPYAFDDGLDNLKLLEKEGARGEYGFYEAIDYTPSRLASTEKSHVVQSHLAHHQGMIVVGLNNILNDDIMPERFHAETQVKATELLLQERFPDRTPIVVPHSDQLFSSVRGEQEENIEISQTLRTPHTTVPITHLLSNAHYALMVDNAGSGFSLYERDIMLTRWREDSIKNDYGMYFFIRDMDSGDLWSSTYQPTRVKADVYEVIYSPDKIEFKRKDHEIFTHSEITVSPEDNVEIRKLSFTNLSSRRRVLEITSYAEVALNSPRADIAHPAFSKMFIESEFVSDLDCLLLSRRPRSQHEAAMHMFHMVTMRTVWRKVQYETARADFLGRGNTIHDAYAMRLGRKLSGMTGSVLDPILSIRTVIELEPGASETVNFVTGASREKEALLGVANRYRQVHQISRAFEMAWSQSSVELRNEKIAARQSQVFQRLANVLLYNVQKFRAPSELIVHNRLAQSALWRLGISGDLPIVMVRITEPDQGKIVQELLAAHHYLRIRGLIFDLVILNEYPGGYLQNLQEELDFMIRSSFSGYLVDKAGGVFLRTAQQVSQQELELLQVVARVVLSGFKGSLGSQLKFDELIIKAPPVEENQLNVSNSKELLKGASKCEFFNGYGGFVDDGRAYRVYVSGDTFPPLPWSNVVSNPNLGFLVTESGGGYTWAENSREFRLTTWTNDPISDPVTEAIYLKDQETDRFWCPTPRPVRSGAIYQVEHGFDGSTFETEVEGIHSNLTIAVASEAKLKCFKLALKNTTRLPRIIECYFYAEWVLGVQRDETSRFIISGFDSKLNLLHAQNFYNMDFPGRVLFLSCSEEIVSYTASRREFIGRNRDLSSPAGLQLAGFEKQVGAGFDSCGVVKAVISIRPNEEKDIHFFIGSAESMDAARQLASKQAKAELFDKQQADTANSMKSIISAIEVKTPDRSLDIMINGWLLYQSIVCRVFARTGFYQSGGAFGFRDQLQDVLSMLLIRPELARKQILLHASRQFPEGDVQHWWHPPTGKGIRTKITDNYLWLPYVTSRYIEATGDTGILDEPVTFITGPQLSDHEMETYMVPQFLNEPKPLYEHCILALERGMRFGVHGIPLMGGGDWNDGMNEVGKDGRGESVWLAWFFAEALQRFSPYISSRGDSERASRYANVIERLAASVEEHAWDGKWYRRAYFDDGTPLGSAQNDECQIDSLSQSWGIITGLADKARVTQAMEEVYARLVDEKYGLIKLLYPPFNTGSLHPGYIKGYLPGIRENGGQYTHAAAWTIIATAMMGYGTKAHKLFQLINPVNHTATEAGAERYRGEPYCLCGDVYAAPPHEGRAGWSWYSGSAGWMYQAVLHYILGLQVNGDIITINPCIPSAWKDYSITANLRGIKFAISVSNPNGVERGVRGISLDGADISDGKIKFSSLSGRKEAAIKVVLG